MGGGKSKSKITDSPQPVSNDFENVNRINLAAASKQNELILQPSLHLTTLPKEMDTKTKPAADTKVHLTIVDKVEEVVKVKAEEPGVEQKPTAPIVDSTPPPDVPDWLNAQYFEEILDKHYSLTPADYTVKNLSTKLATAKGDNYASIMYRSTLDVELQADHNVHSFSFIVKCLPAVTGMSDEFMKLFNLFPKEVKMYQDVVPSFEKLLAENKINVKFGPTCYKAHLGDPTDVIVMEDLAVRDYKMANRRVGLDMEHTQLILRKMAQWHAASAVLYERNGPYDECFNEGIYSEKIRPMMEGYMGEQEKVIIPIVESWSFGKKYVAKIKRNHTSPEVIDALIACTKPDPDAFNVLNHGDMWCNNMMFIYDSENKLQDALLVDYQISNYGPPIMDLCYFLFSSTQFEIKLSEFEYFFQYYHENLTECLTKMEYPKRMPRLNELFMDFYRRGFYVSGLAFGLLAIVLLDKTDDASIDNMMKTDEVGTNFKKALYNNPLFVRQMEQILPFLDKRGLLTF